MPKQKTHKGLAKRVKVTGRGKVRRKKSYMGHLLSGRASKRRRRLRQSCIMVPADAKRSRTALNQ